VRRRLFKSLVNAPSLPKQTGQMTRAEQVRKALKLLAPPADRRDECQRDIEFALERVEGKAVTAFRILGSRLGRAGLRRYANALRRARAAFQSLDPAIRPWFSLWEIGHVAGKPTHIDREIAKAEEFLGQPSPSPRANRHKAAVAASSDLLKWWAREPTATRGGEWARLAGILADNQKVDLLDHMRAYKRRRAPTVEKLLGKHSVRYRTVRR
jgi:hypothetical protein